MRGALFAIAIMMSSAGCWAQVGAGAPRLAENGCEGHAWVVVPRGAPTTRRYALLHLPPRGPCHTHDAGLIESPPGSVIFCGELASPPEALGAWGRDVWMFMPESDVPGGAPIRRVFHARVRTAGMGSRWLAYAGGTFDREPVINVAGSLVAAAAGPGGPVALLETTNGPVLLALTDGSWRQAPLPRLGPLQIPFALAMAPDRCLVLAREGDNVHEFHAPWPMTQSTQWVPQPPVSIPGIDAWSCEAIGMTGDTTRLLCRDRATLQLVSISHGALEMRGELPIDNGSACVLVDEPAGGARVVVIGHGDKPNSVRTVEATFPGGAVEFDGPATDASPSPVMGFRIYIVAVILSTALVLVIIIRRGSRKRPAARA